MFMYSRIQKSESTSESACVWHCFLIQYNFHSKSYDRQQLEWKIPLCAPEPTQAPRVWVEPHEPF